MISRTFSVLLAVFLVIGFAADGRGQAKGPTIEGLESDIRAGIAAWNVGDIATMAAGASFARGFGFRTHAARTRESVPPESITQILTAFLDSMDYYRATLDELHVEVNGDVGLARGFFTEDFKRRNQEPEVIRVRFTDTLRWDGDACQSLLSHRDIQRFDSDDRYIVR